MARVDARETALGAAVIDVILAVSESNLARAHQGNGFRIPAGRIRRLVDAMEALYPGAIAHARELTKGAGS